MLHIWALQLNVVYEFAADAIIYQRFRKTAPRCRVYRTGARRSGLTPTASCQQGEPHPRDPAAALPSTAALHRPAAEPSLRVRLGLRQVLAFRHIFCALLGASRDRMTKGLLLRVPPARIHPSPAHPPCYMLNYGASTGFLAHHSRSWTSEPCLPQRLYQPGHGEITTAPQLPGSAHPLTTAQQNQKHPPPPTASFSYKSCTRITQRKIRWGSTSRPQAGDVAVSQARGSPSPGTRSREGKTANKILAPILTSTQSQPASDTQPWGVGKSCSL